VLLFTAGRKIPSDKNPDSQFLAPYWRLLTNKDSALTYLVVLIEGILIIGSFSSLDAFIEYLYQYNNLYIGLMMTAFGVLAVIGGRMSDKLAAKMGGKRVLSLGLLSATLADVIFYLYGSQLVVLVIGIY